MSWHSRLISTGEDANWGMRQDFKLGEDLLADISEPEKRNNVDGEEEYQITPRSSA